MNIFNLTKYKIQMSNYKNCSNQISNKLSIIDGYLAECYEALDKYYGSSTSISGDVVNSFFKESDYCKQRLKIFIDELKDERDNLSLQKDKADELYEHNENLYNEEYNSYD